MPPALTRLSTVACICWCEGLGLAGCPTLTRYHSFATWRLCTCAPAHSIGLQRWRNSYNVAYYEAQAWTAKVSARRTKQLARA